MTHRSLAEVRSRLEQAVELLPGSPESPQDLYDRFEEMAIALFDAEFAEHPPGVLEAYMMAYLRLK